MIGIAKNRQISIKKGEYQGVESLDIQENRTIVKFIVRKSEAILTHFFSSLRAFIKLK